MAGELRGIPQRQLGLTQRERVTTLSEIARTNPPTSFGLRAVAPAPLAQEMPGRPAWRRPNEPQERCAMTSGNKFARHPLRKTLSIFSVGSLLLVAAAVTAVTLSGSSPAAAATVGATTPFTSYEAESGTLGGGATTVSLTTAPTTKFSSAPLEASGHSYVHFSGTGQFVWFTNTTGKPINAINLRYSMPDTAAGGGTTATLDLSVNGVFRQALNVNSKQTWLYENDSTYNGNDQTPADGTARVYFDEVHTFITGDPIQPGSTFAIEKNAANTAAFYDIDVADNNPTNGTGDPGAVDSTNAIQTCINTAQSQGKILWIPQGTFYLKGTAGLGATGITIAGAGPWYSTIYRQVPLPNTVTLGAIFGLTSTTVQNFHIDTNATSRATVDGAGGSMDTTGTNWVANNIWTQHTMSGYWASGTGGTVENCRITAVWADGINFNNRSEE